VNKDEKYLSPSLGEVDNIVFAFIAPVFIRGMR